MSEQYPAAKPEPRDGKPRLYRGGRPCFICGGQGWCKHREPRVDQAELWLPPVDFADLRAIVLEIAGVKA